MASAFHSGRDTGFMSYLIVLPDSGMGVTIMLNTDFIGVKVLVEAILDLLLGKDITLIKRSLAHHLCGISLSAGNETAWKEYDRIQREELEHYLIGDEDFNSIVSRLKNSGYTKEAIQVLELAVRMFPESSVLNNSFNQ